MATSIVDKNSKIVVTGVSGYIASALVDQLFQRGYTNIHGSVRSLNDERKLANLRSLFPRLHLFEADLTKEGSFDKGIEGAAYVFHTASPVILSSDNPQQDIVDPAVKGTLDVLRSAEKAKSVKRVVFTSSLATVLPVNPLSEVRVLTEADWNDDASLETTPYQLSKTLAEKAAWQFIADNHARGGNLELVCINPAFVIGPPVSSRTDTSITLRLFMGLFDGQFIESGTPVIEAGIADVRDVALAHILAIEKPNAHGRYIISTETALDLLEQAHILQREDEFKDYLYPTKREKELAGTFRVSTAKARNELGIEFREPRQTLIDAARKVIELGLVPPVSELRNRPPQQQS